MKIGIDGRLWDETGVGRYIRNLVKEMQSLDRKNDYVLFVNKGSGIEKLKFGSNWKIIVVDIRWHTVEEQFKFPQVLNKENLDLVHFPYFSVPINYKRPFVITIHDLILNHFPTGKASTLPLPLYHVKRFGYKYVLSNAVKNAKQIIVPLNAAKDDLIQTMRVPEKKIVATYEGVDQSLRVKRSNLSKDLPAGKAGIATSSSTPRNDKELGKYFLYVGNAYPHKNLDKLLYAFTQFRKEQKEATLLLVGKDDYFYKKLEKHISDNKITGISFKHDVTDFELSELYRNSKAFVSASLMEGFGLPALEAMSLSCPVLVSDIPSFREVCDDAAIYFDPNSTNDIVSKMKEVWQSNNAHKREYINKGLDRVQKFSWKKMAEKTLKVYEDSFNL